MKKYASHLPAFLILIVLALGCDTVETVESNRIPQTEIIQNYTVSSDRNGTEISAVFYYKNANTTVKLNAPSRIEHNGREILSSSQNEVTGTSYYLYLLDFTPDHKFVYTNGDGTIFRNEMSFQPVEFAAAQPIVSRAQTTIIPLSRHVGAEETAQIYLTSLANRPENKSANSAAEENAPQYNLALENALNAERSAIVLRPEVLEKFVGGKASLQIEVGQEIELRQQSKKSGKMNWRYISRIETEVTN